MNAQTFLLKYAEALQRHGRPAHELEAAVGRRAAQLGESLRILASPTVLLLEADGRATLSNVSAGWVDLQRLDRAEQLADAVADGADPALVAQQLQDLRPLYGPVDQALATIVAGAATAPFFGGGTPEVAAAGLAGLGVAVGDLLARRLGLPSPMTQAVIGAGVAHLASAALGANPTPAILAGLIALMPGFTATTAAAELASGHLIAGMSRGAGAALVLVQLVVGVVLATSIVPAAPVVPSAAAPWTLWLAALASSVAFAVLLGAQARSTVGIALGIGVAWQSMELSTVAFGPLVGAGLAAFSVAALGNVWHRLTGRPADVVAVPGLLLLVPGSMAFRSLTAVLTGDVVGGMGLLAEVITMSVALATGYLLGQRHPR